MTAETLWYLPIRDINRLFRNRQLSPVELTAALLERIERFDTLLHCFVTLTPERALQQARAAERALSDDAEASPLIGIPVGYKDVLATRGVATTAGSAVLADWIPNEDASCVSRLQRRGTVMIGKLITHEFAVRIQGPSHRFPPARNPWNLACIPGGSSSGPAAALAAGMIFGAIGSDTAGSIRAPAAYSGIVGLKPTYGRVSRDGLIPLSWTLDHVGPMARTVEDCAYLLQAIAGYDPADASSSRLPVPDYLSPLRDGIRGVKMGVPRGDYFEGIDPEVEAAFEKAVDLVRGIGAEVCDVRLPSTKMTPVATAIWLTEAFAFHERRLKEKPECYDDVLRDMFLTGGLITGAEYVQAQRLRAQMQSEMAAVLRTVDLLLTPTTRGLAPTYESALATNRPWSEVNRTAFNMTGLPTLALPCGFSSSGLPISLQITGRAFEEAMVLRVGHAYEQATEWHTRHPAIGNS